MDFTAIDWVIIIVFFCIIFGIGIAAGFSLKKNKGSFIKESMPWWILGISMVACTFSSDTPNLVTGMVREDGVFKNWAWWAFLITGMVTVFIYAKLWRRSNVTTDLEFYELRYSGKAAEFLRVFRALYLGVLFNCLTIGTVTLAAIKIGGVMFGLDPFPTVVIISFGVLFYTAMGGLKGVIWVDLFQYSIAMVGAVLAAYYAVTEESVGGLGNLLTHDVVKSKLDVIPDFSNWGLFLSLLIIPVAVQWWAVWYPGAEPGGGGYIAQRMLSAKNERHAIGATLFFNFMHYAIRPWPWILVALASMVIFPDLASIKEYYPGIDDAYLKDDAAYPAMLRTVLPTGIYGLVVAALIAACMSTIGAHLNWGSSYFINDFYQRIVKPNASREELILVGRLCTIGLMIIAGTMSLTIMDSATQAFDILLLSGAGTGAIYLLRWFWHRINAITEIVAMLTAALVACILVFGFEVKDFTTENLDGGTVRLLLAVAINTVAWLVTTFLTKPEKKEVLEKFYTKIHPSGKPLHGLGAQILMIFVGCIAVYSCLFSIGSFIYQNPGMGIILGMVTLVATYILFILRNRVKAN